MILNHDYAQMMGIHTGGLVEYSYRRAGALTEEVEYTCVECSLVVYQFLVCSLPGQCYGCSVVVTTECCAGTTNATHRQESEIAAGGKTLRHRHGVLGVKHLPS
jgi:hypothetical protein